MKNFKEISTKELSGNTFQMIGNDWMLVTATKDDVVNTMTAAWGGLGVLWGKDVAFVVIRPQRYTKEFVDATTTFSLSFFSEKYHSQLSYLGKVSGRNEDKITKANLTTTYIDGTPYFEEAKTVLICKKLYVQPLLENSFLDPTIVEHWYPSKDLHTLYVAQITNVLTR